jgi:hypothetical protein
MRKITVGTVARWLLFTLAIFGVVGVAPIALQQWTGASACPALGPVPACYVALVGYSLVAVSVFFEGRVRLAVFLAGFIPIFALAATGSGLELLGQNACPKSTTGTPLCYYSLALAISLAVLFFLERSVRKATRVLEFDE